MDSVSLINERYQLLREKQKLDEKSALLGARLQEIKKELIKNRINKNGG